MPTQRQTPKAFSQEFQGIMDMSLHGSWRRTGLLGYLGIVLAFYVSHTKDASALLGQGIYGGIYLASHLGILHALMRIGKGRLGLTR